MILETVLISFFYFSDGQTLDGTEVGAPPVVISSGMQTCKQMAKRNNLAKPPVGVKHIQWSCKRRKVE